MPSGREAHWDEFMDAKRQEKKELMRKKNERLKWAYTDENGEELRVEPEVGQEDDDDLGISKKGIPKGTAAAREIAVLEKELRMLERDYEAASEATAQFKAEIKKLKNVIAREQHTKTIMGKSIGELKTENSKLEAEIKALKARLSTDHVLHTRKFGDMVIKRPYK